MLAQNFANSPTYAIADNRPTQGFAYAHSETVAVEAVAAAKRDKQRAGPALAFTVHRIELAAMHQAEGAGPFRGGSERGVRRG